MEKMSVMFVFLHVLLINSANYQLYLFNHDFIYINLAGNNTIILKINSGIRKVKISFFTKQSVKM